MKHYWSFRCLWNGRVSFVLVLRARANWLLLNFDRNRLGFSRPFHPDNQAYFLLKWPFLLYWRDVAELGLVTSIGGTGWKKLPWILRHVNPMTGLFANGWVMLSGYTFQATKQIFNKNGNQFSMESAMYRGRLLPALTSPCKSGGGKISP